MGGGLLAMEKHGRVIAKNVNFAELAQGFFNHRFDLLFTRDICLEEHSISAGTENFLLYGCATRRVELGNHDRGTLAREPFRDTPADTRSTPGDDGYFVFQSHFHLEVSLVLNLENSIYSTVADPIHAVVQMNRSIMIVDGDFDLISHIHLYSLVNDLDRGVFRVKGLEFQPVPTFQRGKSPLSADRLHTGIEYNTFPWSLADYRSEHAQSEPEIGGVGRVPGIHQEVGTGLNFRHTRVASRDRIVARSTAANNSCGNPCLFETFCGAQERSDRLCDCLLFFRSGQEWLQMAFVSHHSTNL